MTPEIVKKPERSREKSKFAVTCSLLSQYIKEKGGIGDLGLGIAKAKSETSLPPTTMRLLPGVDLTERDATRTMDLFPQHAGFGFSDDAADISKIEKPQLTIFYGGKMMVFDNFPTEKAIDLMQLASKGSSPAQTTDFLPLSTTAITYNMNSASHRSSTIGSESVEPPAVVQAQRPPQPNTSYLPMARKASLHRFIERRKDRITARGPYQVSGSKGKPDSVESWLGLASLIAEPAVISRV